MLYTRLIPVLCLLFGVSNGQQFFDARHQRSLYGSGPIGWNTIGGISPIGLGHMTKDELLTLLEAWREVESEVGITTENPPPTPPKKHPKPKPKPKPKPVTTPAPVAPPPILPTLPPPILPPPPPPVPTGAPITVRLPAFVPIQLSAMYTGPLDPNGGPIGLPGIQDPGAPAALPALTAPAAQEATPRLFRFMRMPLVPPPAPLPAEPPVVRNTLDSVDAGTGPIASHVKPRPHLPASPQIARSAPRFVPPPAPFLAHAPGPLELVPSSQLLSYWQ